MPGSDPQGEHREVSEIVEIVSEVGGKMAETALTLVTDPFVGSASGVVVARVLTRVAHEIEQRILVPRQRRRIDQAAEALVEAAKKEQAAGREARSDGFFDRPSPDDASPAEEILEGVFRTAADEWEERKVPYIGRIFGMLSFDPSVTPSDASYLLKLSDRLTYQQVVLLAFWEAAQDSSRPYEREVMSASIRLGEGRSHPTAMILTEMNDLASVGLLGLASTQDLLPPEIPGLPAFGTSPGSPGVRLNNVRLTDMGETLYRLMGLDKVPDQDLEQVAKALHGNS